MAALEYEKLGAEIKQIPCPCLITAFPYIILIGTSETSSNLGRYDGIRYGQGRENFTPETMRRIMLGTYALSAGYYDAYYKKSPSRQDIIYQGIYRSLSECDAILMPVMPMPPTKIGELINDPIQNILADIYTCQTPTGLPSLALPCGFTKNNLPTGMQIIGKMFDEPLFIKN